MTGLGRTGWLLLVCLLALASCTLPRSEEPVAKLGEPIPVPALPAASPSAKTYRIDPEASTLHILVYRGGRLAKLGHNHVISSRNISGSLWQGVLPEHSGFAIRVPVNTLIVDDNATRAAEGDDFPLNVTDEAKQATKTNMLRETLLDAARYPEISLQSVSVQDGTNAPTVLVALRIKDQTRQIAVPVLLTKADERLHVTGSFQIRQTDFGITPLNVGLGALLVLDAVTIKFELVATAN